MGFVEDIEEILRSTSNDKKMLLFSATMPKQILKIAKKHMKEYDFTRFTHLGHRRLFRKFEEILKKWD